MEFRPFSAEGPLRESIHESIHAPCSIYSSSRRMNAS